MASDIENYISSQLRAGVSRGDITHALIERGWDESTVSSAFSQIGTTVQQASPSLVETRPATGISADSVNQTSEKRRQVYLFSSLDTDGIVSLWEKLLITLCFLLLLGVWKSMWSIQSHPEFLGFSDISWSISTYLSNIWYIGVLPLLSFFIFSKGISSRTSVVLGLFILPFVVLSAVKYVCIITDSCDSLAVALFAVGLFTAGALSSFLYPIVALPVFHLLFRIFRRYTYLILTLLLILPFFVFSNARHAIECQHSSYEGFTREHSIGLCITEIAMKKSNASLCHFANEYADYKGNREAKEPFCEFAIKPDSQSATSSVLSLLSNYMGVENYSDTKYAYSYESGLDVSVRSMSTSDYLESIEDVPVKKIDLGDGELRLDMEDIRSRASGCMKTTSDTAKKDSCLKTLVTSYPSQSWIICERILLSESKTRDNLDRETRMRHTQCMRAGAESTIPETATLDEFINLLKDVDLALHEKALEKDGNGLIDDWFEGCRYINKGDVSRSDLVSCVLAVADHFNNTDVCSWFDGLLLEPTEAEVAECIQMGNNR